MVLSDLYNGWDDVTSFAFPCFLFRFLLCFLMRWLRPPCMYLSSPFPRTRNRLETVEASATGCVHTDGARPKPCSARTRWPKLACALAPRTAAAPHNGAAALEAGPARHDARATLPHAGAGAGYPAVGGASCHMHEARSAPIPATSRLLTDPARFRATAVRRAQPTPQETSSTPCHNRSRSAPPLCAAHDACLAAAQPLALSLS
eukprot:CAMPEP_0184517002 /NCGR_PEP_ID=MMETSP0198_2-20121128/5330_1 /TAXON_ID=1112570 /ORGANISM="Thraustochytrium sp., Strain LLF1b" /LENGTH=203 /DNA_ID=CAMNT_0026907361 /DNA_START=207 /DNA_END=816 /DNA_ORIENTATION=+